MNGLSRSIQQSFTRLSTVTEVGLKEEWHHACLLSTLLNKGEGNLRSSFQLSPRARFSKVLYVYSGVNEDKACFLKIAQGLLKTNSPHYFGMPWRTHFSPLTNREPRDTIFCTQTPTSGV